MPLHLGSDRREADYDAFARLRVSDPETLFDSKSVFDNQPLLFDDAETSGSGTGSSHDADTSSVNLSVALNTAGTRVRQSKRRMLYQPGKSQLIFLTFTLGAAAAGITRRVGYFDGDNGIFLEQTNSALSFVRRTSTSGSAVDNDVASGSWSLDTMSDLDVTKSQIMVIDFEWLGVGRVRVGFVIAGKIRYAHEFLNANVLAGVYMTTPNLPVRWEIDNDGTGAASTLEAICATVMSEGGQNGIGMARSIDRGSTSLSWNSSSIQPLLAVRLKSTALDTATIIRSIDLFSTTSGTFRWSVLLDPTVSGTALSFSSVAADSTIEADTSVSSATTVTGGTVLASGYGEASGVANLDVNLDIHHALGSDIDGTAEIIVLAIERVAGSGTEEVYGSMQVVEQV